MDFDPEDDAAADLEDSYRSILRRKQLNSVQLVDNLDFLAWAATHGSNRPLLPADCLGCPSAFPLSEEVEALLTSEGGATPLTTVEQIEGAMDALFRQRVDLGLEVEAILDLPQFASTQSCSERTRTVARDLQDEILDNIVVGLKRDN